jgi:hypothetical protein
MKAPADNQLARGTQDAKRAPGHSQLAVFVVRHGLELAVDRAHRRTEL